MSGPLDTAAALPPEIPANDASSGVDVPGSIDETSNFALEMFDQVNLDTDGDEGPITPEPPLDAAQPPAAAPAVTEPTAKRVVVPPPAVVPPQTPAASVGAGQATPPVTAPATPAAPAVSAPPPEQVAAAPAALPQAVAPENIFAHLNSEVAKYEKEFTKVLAEKQYAMSAEELERFNEDPAAVIAAQAAKVHMNVVRSLTHLFHEQMPVYLNGLMEAKSRASEREQEFWTANPSLNKAQHNDLVRQIGGFVRQTNPNIDKASYIAQVGRMALAALGTTAVATQQPPPTPNGNAGVRTPGPVVRPNGAVPWQPAGSNTAPPGALPGRQAGEWDGMGQDFD